MMVRKDLIDLNFGYRKLSIADALDKHEDERNFVEARLVEMATFAFKEKAGLRLRQGEDVWQTVVKATKSNLVVKSWSTLTGNLRSNWSELILLGVSPASLYKHHRVALKGVWNYRKDSAKLFELEHGLEVGSITGKQVAEAKREILALKDALARNPVTPLIDAGLMPTIVEDVAEDDDIYSSKSRFVKSLEGVADKINPHVRSVGKEVLMLEGSTAYEIASYATQISDFLSRYTLYQHLTTGKNPIDSAAAIQQASDAFINYDIPTHRMVQYANDSGMVMFTKYYLRIQKILVKIYRENPGRAMGMLALESWIGAQPTVMDSSMLTRWGNPLNMGALDYPGSIDAITTVQLITAPFRSGGGNPAE